MANILELKNISRWYGEGKGRVNVLTGVDLTIKAGQSIAIVGPSGSGKSTLLHVAGLLDKADKGSVKVNGQDVAGLADDTLSTLRNQTFGFVYQFHHLLREFNGLENVTMPSLMAQAPLADLNQRAENLLKIVGLGKRLHHLPGQLSGGEQQRVAIARALMNKPQLLLADEPTGNLDPHTADEVVDMLFNLIENEGLAALIVTHNMALAKRCNLILRMEEGRLVR